MKLRMWTSGVLAGAIFVVGVQLLLQDARAEGGEGFKECTVIRAYAHPELGPKWPKALLGTTDIPTSWSVVGAVGGTVTPGILVCR